MRKELKEIIENLKDVEASMRACGGLVNLENSNRMVQQIGRLSELAKPVQYVVETRCSNDYLKHGQKDAFMNGEKIYSWDIMFILKDRSLGYINYMHRALGLPPITIEQIKFVDI